MVGAEKRLPRISSDKYRKIYRLAIPALKSTSNLVILRRSCARTAKKFTKKRAARSARAVAVPVLVVVAVAVLLS